MQSLLTPKSPPNPFARNHLLRDASWKAVYDQMAVDPAVHVFGEGAAIKAHYDAPAIEKDFLDRVHTMPISEDGNTNFAVGASLLGVKPIVDVISADFLYRTLDSICNTAAKINFVLGPDRQPSIIVIRAEFLVGGPTTGQRPEALFAHIPGLHVVIPSTPRDAYGLMRTALETPGVTLYFEDRMIADDGDWSEEDLTVGERVPFGSMAMRWLPMTTEVRKMPLVTVLTYGVMRQRVEKIAANWLKAWDGDYYVEPNLSMDLFDLRSLYPIDFEHILRGRYSVLGRTRKLLIIEPDVAYGGIGAEIAARVAEEQPQVRVRRLGAPRQTIPAAASLHHHMLPSKEAIVAAITSDW